MKQNVSLEVATLAGGCFWCVEAVFREIDGVDHIVSGYTSGNTIDPNYDQVCTGKTGHAEAVQVSFTLPGYLIGRYWRFSSLSMTQQH